MSADIVIRAEGLGKKYVIGHQAQSNTTLRDSITRSIRAWGRSARDIAAGRAIVTGDETEEFWALKDVNFEIRRGDVIGVVGRNGAGKSTLLKVLSRITEPTEGRVTIDGRVASLLEVGTGFHGELSGRENIFLNGAILGMGREEIRRKFDEIVTFAGVEKFLDTPVKRYSSGMYVRLAFAVAAHLEPEILIVDEVLAVGDAEFQKKCLGKMQDVAGQGRTVLFVSHNMAAVRSLCSSGLMLADGRVSMVGDVGNVISAYLAKNERRSVVRRERKHHDIFISEADASWKNETITLALKVYAKTAMRCAIEAKILDQNSNPVGLASIGSWSSDTQIAFQRGENSIVLSFSSIALAHGSYGLVLGLTDPGRDYFDAVDDELKVDIPDRFRPGEQRGLGITAGHGAVRFDLVSSC